MGEKGSPPCVVCPMGLIAFDGRRRESEAQLSYTRAVLTGVHPLTWKSRNARWPGPNICNKIPPVSLILYPFPSLSLFITTRYPDWEFRVINFRKTRTVWLKTLLIGCQFRAKYPSCSIITFVLVICKGDKNRRHMLCILPLPWNEKANMKGIRQVNVTDRAAFDFLSPFLPWISDQQKHNQESKNRVCTGACFDLHSAGCQRFT